MLKKFMWVAVAIFIFAIIIILVRGKEDTWICQKGTWVKHGNPASPAPTYFCDK